jgi:hypothetical protein
LLLSSGPSPIVSARVMVTTVTGFSVRNLREAVKRDELRFCGSAAKTETIHWP